MDTEKREHLIFIPEALKHIPISRENLYRKIKSKAIPSYRIGRRVLVSMPEVLAAIRQR